MRVKTYKRIMRSSVTLNVITRPNFKFSVIAINNIELIKKIVIILYLNVIHNKESKLPFHSSE